MQQTGQLFEPAPQAEVNSRLSWFRRTAEPRQTQVVEPAVLRSMAQERPQFGQRSVCSGFEVLTAAS